MQLKERIKGYKILTESMKPTKNSEVVFEVGQTYIKSLVPKEYQKEFICDLNMYDICKRYDLWNNSNKVLLEVMIVTRDNTNFREAEELEIVRIIPKEEIRDHLKTLERFVDNDDYITEDALALYVSYGMKLDEIEKHKDWSRVQEAAKLNGYL